MIKTNRYTPINNIWDIPFLPPLAEAITGIDSITNCLTNRLVGEWCFLNKTIDSVPGVNDKCQDFDFSIIDNNEWSSVIVPSSLNMQGFDVENNNEYYYKKIIRIDKEALNNSMRIFLRFEGVYCNSRVWANGKYLATHIGGFTPFVTEIPEQLINADNECELVIGISDIEGVTKGLWNENGKRMSNAAWASFYAHNNICGILRNITLFYLPDSFVLSNHIKTVLTNGYNDGEMTINALIVLTKNTDIKLKLLDLSGNPVICETIELSQNYRLDKEIYNKKFSLDLKGFNYKLHKAKKSDEEYSKEYIRFRRCDIKGDLYGISIKAAVENVKKWSAEKPQLYTLKMTLSCDGREVVYEELVGFRQIEYAGANNTDKNKVYVNGKEIKLRGVCRHDISHQYGRSLSAEEELQEILAFKRNNVNHVRTSHYPTSKNYLKLCDIHGIYVELENSVCFKGANGYDTLCSPEEIIQILSEMIEYSFNHPSILIWSIGNESGFEKSAAYRLSYNYVKEKDASRPVIFSYPFTIKTKPMPYDIFSKHYHKVFKNLGDKSIPKLHDEFAHIACYNIEDLARDNNIRLAWGDSIRKGWSRIMHDDGALGCALWGGIDDVFYLPIKVKTVHQRHTASQALGYGEWGAILDVFKREKPEAYLTKKAFSPIVVIDSKIKNDKLVLNIENRFDHTNICDVECVVTSGAETVYSGLINTDISPHTVGTAELPISVSDRAELSIAFYYDGYEIDREIINEYRTEFFSNKIGDNLSLLTNRESNEVLLLADNVPIAKCGNLYVNAKKLEPISRKITEKTLNGRHVIYISDSYGATKRVMTRLKLNDDNTLGISLKCSLVLLPILGNSFSVGFDLINDVSSVEWNRATPYSYYPQGHIARNKGIANRQAIKANEYGVKPDGDWADDCYNYFLNDVVDTSAINNSNDFKTTRTDIKGYAVNFADKSIVINSSSIGMNCFTECKTITDYYDCTNDKIQLVGKWKFINKNLEKCCVVSRKKNSSVSCDFYGTGIKIFGTRSKTQGNISIYIDGVFLRTVSTRSDICDVLDFAVLDTVNDLAKGAHTVQITVDDDKGVRISGFETIGGNAMETSTLLVGKGKRYASLGWGNWCGEKLNMAERKRIEFDVKVVKKDE